jgi:hypothetical protein
LTSVIFFRVPIQFHEDALHELHLSYVPDAAALSALVTRSSELGVRFPAAFVEWYGMRDGITLLRQHSNSDEPVEIAKLGAPTWPFKDGNVPESEHGRMLQFMVENQGVCTWGIALDAGDDPPVLVAVDPNFEWRAHAASFSTFIACQIWDYEKVHSGVLLAAQAGELAQVDLELLRPSFREKTTTHGWPTKNIFRFERADGRVIVWDGDGQADWWISAHSEENIAALARELWSCGDLSTSMYGLDERGERVLRSLRQQR